MFNCYNCRKDFEGDPPYLFNNERYCNLCKKYMPSIPINENKEKPISNVVFQLIENEEKIQPVKIIPSDDVKSYKENKYKENKELDKKLSGYEPYKLFKCNSCGAYYEDYTSSSYENLKEAKKCCKSSVTPFCSCSHRYRWKSISDANGCCEIDEDSLELKE